MLLMLNEGENRDTYDPVLVKRYWSEEFTTGKYRFLMYSQWYDDRKKGATKEELINRYNTL